MSTIHKGTHNHDPRHRTEGEHADRPPRTGQVRELGTRTDRVVSWIGWHLGELSGVLVPAYLAVAWTPWAWAVSGVVAAGWTAHEVRVAREQAVLKAALRAERAALAPGSGLVIETPEHDTTSDAGDATTGDMTAGDVAADPAAGWGGVR